MATFQVVEVQEIIRTRRWIYEIEAESEADALRKLRDGEEPFDFGCGEDIDAGPLMSRCIPIPLTNQGLAEAFAGRALEIARAEGLDGQPIEAYIKLARKHKNNMRAILQEIDRGIMAAS